MKDKVVWITGASSGIGAACAAAFSQLGAKLILSARREKALKEVQVSLPGPSAIVPLDVSQPDTFDQAIKDVLGAFGHVDVFINNAGISQRGTVLKTDIEVDRRLFEVNYFGNIGLTKKLLPSMLERKSGHFVIISSVAGKLSTPGRSSYAATKHALHGFYDALRAEVTQDGLSVLLVCPGYIRTDISINALNEKGEKHNVMDPNQEAGLSPEACANSIVKGINKNKKEIYIGGKEVKFVTLRKFMPSMYYSITEKMAREKSY